MLVFYVCICILVHLSPGHAGKAIARAQHQYEQLHAPGSNACDVEAFLHAHQHNMHVGAYGW